VPAGRIDDGKAVDRAEALMLPKLGGMDSTHVAVAKEDAEHGQPYSPGAGSVAVERQMPRRLACRLS
jgi:hypothetical protein